MSNHKKDPQLRHTTGATGAVTTTRKHLSDDRLFYQAVLHSVEKQISAESSKQVKAMLKMLQEYIGHKLGTDTSPTSQPHVQSFASRTAEANFLLFPFHVISVLNKGRIPEATHSVWDAAFSTTFIEPHCPFDPPTNMEVPRDAPPSVLTRWFRSSGPELDFTSQAAARASLLRDVLLYDVLESFSFPILTPAQEPPLSVVQLVKVGLLGPRTRGDSRIEDTVMPSKTAGRHNHRKTRSASYADPAVDDSPLHQQHGRPLGVSGRPLLVHCLRTLQRVACGAGMTGSSGASTTATGTSTGGLSPASRAAKEVLSTVILRLCNGLIPSEHSHQRTESDTAISTSAGIVEEGDPHHSTINDFVEVIGYCTGVKRASEAVSVTPRSSPASPSAVPESQGGKVLCPAYLPLAEEEGQPMVVSSLGMILSLLVNGGPEVRRNERILSVFKRKVISYIIHNAMSTDYDTYRLAFSVFLSLYSSCSACLIAELVAVFDVISEILESHQPGQNQRKLIAVEVLAKIAEEPRNLIELFLNYDCVQGCTNVYERIVRQLRGLYLSLVENQADAGSDSTGAGPNASPELKGSSNKAQFDVPEAEVVRNVRRMTLQTLLLIARSHADWVERFEGDAAEDEQLNKQRSELEADDFAKVHREKQHQQQIIATFNAGHPMEALSHVEVPTATTNEDREQRKEGRMPTCESEDTTENNAGALTTASSIAVSPGPAAGHGLEQQFRCVHHEDCLKASAVARFLRTHEDYIDKFVLGDWFSGLRRKPFVRLVLIAWIYTFDFSQCSIDEALRLFLGGFKLVGEAQIVDATMELFSQAYCSSQAPGAAVFKSASAAFILSFSICMLNTDLHSINIKDKDRMTKESFRRNNRGINDGEDLPDDVLGEIFERIATAEIKLRPTSLQPHIADDAGRGSGKGESRSLLADVPILKHLTPVIDPVATVVTGVVMAPVMIVDLASDRLFRKSREESAILQARTAELQAALKKALTSFEAAKDGAARRVFASGSQLQHAIPMWTLSTEHCVASFAVGLNSSDQEEFHTAVEGVRHTVHVSSRFGCIAAADPLIASMFELIGLRRIVDVRNQSNPLTGALSDKGALCLELAFNIFTRNGDCLSAHHWEQPFLVLSLLEFTGLMKPSLIPGEDGNSQQGGVTSKSKPKFRFFGSTPPPASPALSRVAVLRQESRKAIVDVFGESGLSSQWAKLLDLTSLPAKTQCDAIAALCSVCRSEIPLRRTFSLVELANALSVLMGTTTRMIWREIWKHSSGVLVTAAVSEDPAVMTTAVDLLRELALSFLEREERLHFRDQREVLQPFESVLMQNFNTQARTYLLRTWRSMIRAKAVHFASGWHSILNGLSHAALLPDVVVEGWKLMSYIVREHLLLLGHNVETLRLLVLALASFACNMNDVDIALAALSGLLFVASCIDCGIPTESKSDSLRTPPPAESEAENCNTRSDAPYSMEQLEEKVQQQFVIHTEQKQGVAASLLSTNAPIIFATQDQLESLWRALVDAVGPIVMSSQRPVEIRVKGLCTLFRMLFLFGTETFELKYYLTLMRHSVLPVVRSLAPSHRMRRTRGSECILLWSLAQRCLISTGYSEFVRRRSDPNWLKNDPDGKQCIKILSEVVLPGLAYSGSHRSSIATSTTTSTTIPEDVAVVGQWLETVFAFASLLKQGLSRPRGQASNEHEGDQFLGTKVVTSFFADEMPTFLRSVSGAAASFRLSSQVTSRTNSPEPEGGRTAGGTAASRFSVFSLPGLLPQAISQAAFPSLSAAHQQDSPVSRVGSGLLSVPLLEDLHPPLQGTLHSVARHVSVLNRGLTSGDVHAEATVYLHAVHLSTLILAMSDTVRRSRLAAQSTVGFQASVGTALELFKLLVAPPEIVSQVKRRLRRTRRQQEKKEENLKGQDSASSPMAVEGSVELFPTQSLEAVASDLLAKREDLELRSAPIIAALPILWLSYIVEKASSEEEEEEEELSSDGSVVLNVSSEQIHLPPPKEAEAGADSEDSVGKRKDFVEEDIVAVLVQTVHDYCTHYEALRDGIPLDMVGSSIFQSSQLALPPLVLPPSTSTKSFGAASSSSPTTGPSDTRTPQCLSPATATIDPRTPLCPPIAEPRSPGVMSREGTISPQISPALPPGETPITLPPAASYLAYTAVCRHLCDILQHLLSASTFGTNLACVKSQLLLDPAKHRVIVEALLLLVRTSPSVFDEEAFVLTLDSSLQTLFAPWPSRYHRVPPPEDDENRLGEETGMAAEKQGSSPSSGGCDEEEDPSMIFVPLATEISQTLSLLFTTPLMRSLSRRRKSLS